MPKRSVRAQSYRQQGRLVPPSAQGLRAATVVLQPGALMDWHSTQLREELLIALSGQVRLDVQAAAGVLQRVSLTAGHCVFLGRATRHRVVNRSTIPASYIYVTAPVGVGA